MRKSRQRTDEVDLELDRRLVVRAQAGDLEAFDELYRRYRRRIYRFCLRRLRDVHEAEDVTQESFTRAWRALSTFSGERRFYPWLTVIAGNLCTDIDRKRSRSVSVEDPGHPTLASTEPGGEDEAVGGADRELLSEAFGRLSDRHQRILNLRETEGWSYKRIADHEDMGITAVETLLWRARRALKREFTRLSGDDERLGAGIGLVGVLSLLRRLFGGAPRAVRRLADLAAGAPAVAGSAIAATAAVLSATFAGSPAVTVPAAGTTAPSASATGGLSVSGSSRGVESSGFPSASVGLGAGVPNVGPWTGAEVLATNPRSATSPTLVGSGASSVAGAANSSGSQMSAVATGASARDVGGSQSALSTLEGVPGELSAVVGNITDTGLGAVQGILSAAPVGAGSLSTDLSGAASSVSQVTQPLTSVPAVSAASTGVAAVAGSLPSVSPVTEPSIVSSSSDAVGSVADQPQSAVSSVGSTLGVGTLGGS